MYRFQYLKCRIISPNSPHPMSYRIYSIPLFTPVNLITLRHLACHFNQLICPPNRIDNTSPKSAADLVISSLLSPIKITEASVWPFSLLLYILNNYELRSWVPVNMEKTDLVLVPLKTKYFFSQNFNKIVFLLRRWHGTGNKLFRPRLFLNEILLGKS